MKTLFTLCLCLILSGALLASDYYWVGGSGNWSDFSHHWATTSGGTTFHTSAPTTSDDVFFDANSFTGAAVLILDENASTRSLNFASINQQLTLALSNTLTLSGSLTLSQQMTLVGLKNVIFDSSDSGNTISTAGNTYPAIVVFQGGGTWTLTDELKTNTSSASYGIQILSGTLNTNSQRVTTSRVLANTNNGLFKSLILGNSSIYLAGAWGANYLDVIDAGTSNIYMLGVHSGSSFTSKSSQIYNNLTFQKSAYLFTTSTPNTTFNKISGLSSVKFNQYFKTDSLILLAGNTFNFYRTSTTTVYDHFAIVDNKDFPTTINSTVVGTAAKLALPTEICAEHLSVQDLNFTGSAIFKAAYGSVDLGNNIGVDFYPTTHCDDFGATLYWVGGSGNWSDYANHWATSSGGSSFTNDVPGENDNVIFDQNSFSAPWQTITLDVAGFVKDMDWTGVLNSPTFDMNSPLTAYGDLRFFNQMILEASTIILESEETESIFAPAGQTFLTIYVRGDYQLVGDLDANKLTVGYLGKDVFLSTNNYDVNALESIYVTYGGVNLGSSTLTTGEWALGFDAVIEAGTSTIIITNWLANNVFTKGANIDYYNIVFNVFSGLYGNGNWAITANSVSFLDDGVISVPTTTNSLSLSAGHDYILTHSVTLDNLIAIGDCDNMISIIGGGGYNAGIISNSSSITVDYLEMTNVGASGTASFAATHSIDNGGNTGWTFASAPSCAETFYWVGGSGNWSDYSNHWATSSGGAIFAGAVPDENVNVVFDNNSFSGGDQTVTLDVAGFVKNMDWTGVLNFPTFDMNGSLNVFGSLIFSQAMLVESSAIKLASVEGDAVFVPGNHSFSSLYFEGIYDLMGSLNASSLNVGNLPIQGALTTNDHDVQVTGRTYVTYGSFDLGSSELVTGTWQVATSASIIPGTSTITLTEYLGDNRLARDLPISYHNIIVADFAFLNKSSTYGSAIANSIEFLVDGEISLPVSTNELILSSGHNYVLNYDVTLSNLFAQGGCENLISITSNSASITSNSTVVNADFVSLTNVVSAGSAAFTATNSIDNGGNTGWVFPAYVPCTPSGSMARMTETTPLNASPGTLIPSVIYPNPFESNFTVINPYQGKGEVEVRIIDQAGKVVFLEKRDAGAEQFDIQLKTITRGMYMLMLTQGDKMISHKIVKE